MLKDSIYNRCRAKKWNINIKEREYRKSRTAPQLTEGSIRNDLFPLQTKETFMVIMIGFKQLLTRSIF